MSRESFFKNYDASEDRYVTLEFYNSGFGVKRFITNQQGAVTLTLETDAPRNANQLVTFEPAPFRADEPEQNRDGDIDLNVSIGGVTGEIIDTLAQRNRQEPVQMIWREHITDSTYPTMIFSFELLQSQVRDYIAALKGGQPNYSGRDVSDRYTNDRFPGLGLAR